MNEKEGCILAKKALVVYFSWTNGNINCICGICCLATKQESCSIASSCFFIILFLPTHHSLHDVDKFHNVLRRIFGVQDSIGDGIFLAPIASERDQGRMDSVPKVNGNHWSPGVFRIVKHIEIIWWDIMDMDLRMIFLNLIAQVVDIGCIAALHHEDGFAI